MRIIEINKEQFLNLLLNKNPFDCGSKGIITLINNKLYKVYYKDFIKTYISKNDSELDNEVEIHLEAEKRSKSSLRIPNKQLEKFSRLLETKSNDLITGVLSYKGLLVGIEMNYYEGYINLSEAAKNLAEEEIDKYIRISYDLAKDLMIHDIVPNDINETNILINIETNDVKLIDLDGRETTYGPKNYIKNYPYNIKCIKRKFNEITSRLKNNNYQKVYDRKL